MPGKPRLTTKEIIKRFRKKYGNKYGYSKVVYSGMHKKVIIICHDHGEFLQSPWYHLKKKYGCRKCANYESSVRQLKDTDYFVSKAIKLHGNKYDYSKSIYTGCKNKLIVICPIHGHTEQTPSNHLSNKGGGCKACGIETRSNTRKLSVDVVMKRFKENHGDTYDYSLVEYTNTETPVTILCKKHGEFYQRPNNHMKGTGCPKCFCKKSKMETELFNWLPVKAEQGNRSLIGKEIDIYMADKNIAIELNGVFWHSSASKSNNYHMNKTKSCATNGVRLIHIWEDDWLFRKPIIKSFIGSLLGVKCRIIYARKTVFKEINYKISNEFLGTNHIQGGTKSMYYYGVY